MQLPQKTRGTVKESTFSANTCNESQTTLQIEGSITVEKGDLSRIREIQRELTDIEKRQKNLLLELYGLMGIRTDHTSIKTSRNRLSKEQARRLCGC